MPRNLRHLSILIALFSVSALASGSCCLAAPGPQKMNATDRSMVDADFAFQGEYLGTSNEDEKVGFQVIARGAGKFDVVRYEGGLPGAGWQRKDPKGDYHAIRDGERVTLQQGENHVGSIKDGRLVYEEPNRRVVAERIERKSETLGLDPPDGAMVLFDGTDLEHFQDGKMNEEKKTLWAGATTEPLPTGPVKIHLEFLLPYMPYATGQARANSGVYLHDCYELQVLDSFGLKGETNECGGFYRVKVPDVNMCLPPLQWQTYDIEFHPPVYENGEKVESAVATVLHNGVVIHEEVELKKTPGRRPEGPGPRPIHLQAHGNKVQYRNIWVDPLD